MNPEGIPPETLVPACAPEQADTDATLHSVPFSFSSRFNSDSRTNPEELVAAAHSGCFATALSEALEKEGYHLQSLDVAAKVRFEREGGPHWTIRRSHLQLHATIPGIEPAIFEEIASQVRVSCPLSRLLNATITLDAHPLP